MEKIKELRLEIDRFINSIQLLQTSREVSLAHTNLQRSKMWLGRCLAEIGSPTPYPQSDNPKSNVIEKQAEHTENTLVGEFNDALAGGGHRQIVFVKVMRECIQRTLDNFSIKIDGKSQTLDGDKLNLYATQSYLALEEAKMWLGNELDRIRRDNESQ